MNLANEPILTRLTPAVIINVIITALMGLGVLDADQGAALLALLSTLGVGAAAVSARSRAVGPVTHEVEVARARSPLTADLPEG